MAVREVAEREPGLRVAPGNLPARPVVAEGPRRIVLAEAPGVGEAVVARHDDRERAVDRMAKERLGVERLRADRRGVVDGLRLEQALAVPALAAVDQGLVEERDIGRAGDTAAAGDADRALRRFVEAEDRLRGRFAPAAGRGFRRAHVLAIGDPVLLAIREPDEEAVELERVEQPFADVRAEVLARAAFEDLHQHPVGGSGVVLVLRARLPVQTPAGHRAEAPFAGAPLARAEWG